MDEHPSFGEQPPSGQQPAYGPPRAQEPAPIQPHHMREVSQRGGPGAGAVFMAALFGAVLGAVVAAAGVYFLLAPATSTVTSISPTISTTTRPGAVLSTQPIEAAAADVLPSVVNVAVSSSQGSGVGSGVILRSDGYILTNFHVVEGAQSITVRLGTTTYPARIVGTDQTSDLAVIKVSKTGLRAATIGTSANLVIGETVLAIGSPFGLDKTVTSGIVSALHRSNVVQGSTGITAYSDLIQTDAAINPGNSGGALVDITGAVVGLNTLIESPSGQLGASQSAGIGFAIPIDYAISVADQLIAGKTIAHPYLGVQAMSVTPALAQWYGLPTSTGALVTQVDSGSPAAKAGIRAGDTITRMGTTDIASADDLYMELLKSSVGQPIQIRLVRGNGSTATVSVTLVAR